MTGKEIASYPEAKQVMKTFDHARNQSCTTAPAQPLSYKKIICGETAIEIVETGMGHSEHTYCTDRLCCLSTIFLALFARPLLCSCLFFLLILLYACDMGKTDLALTLLLFSFSLFAKSISITINSYKRIIIILLNY